ncbi:MAG: CdaR family protein [Lachnospiraceae bacterium]|nr:CdaR family protein [Lachnospiraceae bacterium]
MKKKLTNNLGLKLLAFVVAVALWLVVVNIDDPVITNTYSGISVEVLNVESLTDQGKVYEVLNGTDTISVTVTGKRSILDSISKENIRATADLKDLTLMDTVAINLATNKNFNQIEGMKSDTAALQLSIEDLMTKHFSVSVDVSGEPEDGFIVGSVTSSINTVSVSGPASVISKIASVKGGVSVAGRSSDMTTTSALRCYDENGKIIEHAGIAISASNVSVSVEVLATKAVEVHYGYEGTPAAGFVVGGPIISDRNAIYLAGSAEVLAGVGSVEVPSFVVNVDGAKEEVVKKLNLYDYLPEGVIFADENFLGNVTVRVPIEKTERRSVQVAVDKIVIHGVPQGFTAEIQGEEETGEVTLQVEGLTAVLEEANLTDLAGIVDLQNFAASMPEEEEWKDGEYVVPVELLLPDGITLAEDSKVTVILRRE